MWVVVILLVVFMIGKFVYDKNKVNTYVARQGGITQKYKTLIEHFKGGNPNVKILKITEDSVEVGVTSASGSTVFSIIHSFEKVIITWKVNGLVMGNHGLKWEFHHLKDQNEIAEIVHKELNIYQNNVLESKDIY
ncbi:hypothetical protein [Winogradskyella sediminis]|uniref:hypothetical protein n=1 Tax=Winogradskyella sediminis TaxID=1382466 RepID=UPI003AA8C1FB